MDLRNFSQQNFAQNQSKSTRRQTFPYFNSAIDPFHDVQNKTHGTSSSSNTSCFSGTGVKRKAFSAHENLLARSNSNGFQGNDRLTLLPIFKEERDADLYDDYGNERSLNFDGNAMVHRSGQNFNFINATGPEQYQRTTPMFYSLDESRYCETMKYPISGKLLQNNDWVQLQNQGAINASRLSNGTCNSGRSNVHQDFDDNFVRDLQDVFELQLPTIPGFEAVNTDVVQSENGIYTLRGPTNVLDPDSERTSENERLIQLMPQADCDSRGFTVDQRCGNPVQLSYVDYFPNSRSYPTPSNLRNLPSCNYSGNQPNNGEALLDISDVAIPSCNKPKKKRSGISSSRYRGVSVCGKDKRFQVRIRAGQKVLYLGRYKDELEAARRYDLAAIKYHGDKALLNFSKADYIRKDIGSTNGESKEDSYCTTSSRFDKSTIPQGYQLPNEA